MKLKNLLFVSFVLLLSTLLLAGCADDSDDPCPEWYRIKSGNVGQTQCVRGIVKRTTYDADQDFSYVFFSGDVNEFFIGFEGDTVNPAIIGQCYTATGLVEETEYGTIFIVPENFSRCRAEQQVIPTESKNEELPIAAAVYDLTDCMNWDEVDLSYVGQEVCIKGEAWTTNFEDDEYGGFFYIEFGGTLADVYFAVDGANLEGIEGHCVVAKGNLEKEAGWDIPYLWIYPEDLYHCD